MKPVEKVDIYGTDIFIVTTKKKWKKLCRQFKWLDRKAYRSYGYTHFHHGSNTIVLWINKEANLDRGQLVNTCTHESIHAAGFLLEASGHSISGGDEPFAYLSGWLAQLLWTEVTK